VINTKDLFSSRILIELRIYFFSLRVDIFMHARNGIFAKFIKFMAENLKYKKDTIRLRENTEHVQGFT